MHYRIPIAELLLLLAMWLPANSMAGLLLPEKLDTSVSKAAVVVVGEILKAQEAPVKTEKHSALLWEYRVKVLEVIQGTVGRMELPVTFAEPDFSKMATDGRLPFSPIVKGSGLEKALRVGEKYVLLFRSASGFDKSTDQPARLVRAEPLSSKALVATLLGAKKAWQILKNKAPEIYDHISIAVCDPDKGLLAVLVPYTKAIRVYIVDEHKGSVSMKWVNGLLEYNQLSLLDGYIVLRQNEKEPVLLGIASFYDLASQNDNKEIASGGDPGDFKQ